MSEFDHYIKLTKSGEEAQIKKNEYYIPLITNDSKATIQCIHLAGKILLSATLSSIREVSVPFGTTIYIGVTSIQTISYSTSRIIS